MKKIFLSICFLSIGVYGYASPETYKSRMEEIVGHTIEDKTTTDPRFKELQKKIYELRYSDGGDLQETTGQLINLTLQLYPEVDLSTKSNFVVYGMNDLLYMHADGEYNGENRRFIYDKNGLIDWSNYNGSGASPDFLQNIMYSNIIYCLGQKIIHIVWGVGYGYNVFKDYHYIPRSQEIYAYGLFQNGKKIKEVEDLTITNDPFDFRKTAQAATVNGVYYRPYDLDQDMIPYSEMRLLINDLLKGS